MLKRVTARLESLAVIVSFSVCFHSFNLRCSSPESLFNYCCFLLIIFMASHISLFIHRQCLQLLFEYVGFSLFALSLFKPDGRAATVIFFLLLHSALLSLYRGRGGLRGLPGRVGGSASIDLFISCHWQGAKMLQQLYCICQTISTLAPHVRTWQEQISYGEALTS